MSFAYATQVSTLHGEMPKVERSNILGAFRRSKLRALMVSDLVARGLDVQDCDAGVCGCVVWVGEWAGGGWCRRMRGGSDVQDCDAGGGKGV